MKGKKNWESQVERVVNHHVEDSWSEELLLALLAKKDCKRIIKQYKGELFHEPVMARVLLEAVRSNNDAIVKMLVEDMVHPDVRISGDDETAIEVAKQNGAENICRLLYERGAKLHPPPYQLPWPSVHGNKSLCLKETKSVKEDYRGLIVYLLKEGASKTHGGKDYRIAYPEVAKMIKRERDPENDPDPKNGPDHIMQHTDPNRQDCIRWIHLPMNHVSPASRMSTPLKSVTNAGTDGLAKCATTLYPNLVSNYRSFMTFI